MSHLNIYQHNAHSLFKALLQLIGRFKGTLVVSTLLLVIGAERYQLALNCTDSLPQTLFLIDKKAQGLSRGDFVAFRWVNGGPIPNGIIVIKEIRGTSGDEVSHRQQNDRLTFSINRETLGTIKPLSQKGDPLTPGFVGAIPEKHFFAFAPHPDSLDSRYALTGLIRHDQIVGRAYPLF